MLRQGGRKAYGCERPVVPIAYASITCAPPQDRSGSQQFMSVVCIRAKSWSFGTFVLHYDRVSQCCRFLLVVLPSAVCRGSYSSMDIPSLRRGSSTILDCFILEPRAGRNHSIFLISPTFHFVKRQLGKGDRRFRACTTDSKFGLHIHAFRAYELQIKLR